MKDKSPPWDDIEEDKITTESTSSIEVEIGKTGNASIKIKVYDKDPDAAYTKTKELYDKALNDYKDKIKELKQ